MADVNDGSLIFDTELDESGFEKGTNKLLSMIKSLTDEVHMMGDNMMSSFNKVIPLLQSVANSAATISESLTGTATQTTAANEQIIDTEQRVSDSVKHAADDITHQTEVTENYGGAVRSVQGSVSSLEKEINSLSTGLQSVSSSAETGFANGNAVLAFDSKIRALEQRLEEARTKLAEFGNTNLPTEAYTTLSAQISKAEQALFRLYDRRDTMEEMGVKENSKQWERLAIQIENAEALIAQYERERDNLAANGGAFIKGSETDEYSRMQASLDAANDTLVRNKSLIDQEALAQARLNVLTAQEAVASANTTQAREAALERLRAAQAELKDLANGMSTQADGPSEESVSGWFNFGQVLKNAGAVALSTAAALSKLTLSAVVKGFNLASEAVKKFTARLKQNKLTSNALVKSLTSIKTLLKTRIKRMFISSIFNDIKENINTLARFSSEFNSAMSNIKNRAKELSANISVSMGEVVKAVEPFVSGIIKLFSTAVMQINAFFAALSGKSTVTVAKKQTDSYADSLDGAAKSAEELKNQVYGFDELNKKNSNSQAGSGNGSDLFEEIPVDSVMLDSVKNFFDQLKTAFSNGDWRGIGETVADGFNSIIARVDDWINNVFRPKGVLWAGRIAEILNGLVDGFDWRKAGNTLADGINAAFDILNTFLSNFNFYRLGKNIAAFIDEAIEKTDFHLIGETIGSKLRGAVDFAFGLVTEWRDDGTFEKLGKKIGDAINGFFERMGEINPETGLTGWQEIGETLAITANGIIEMLKAAFEWVNWSNVKTALGDMISSFLSNASTETKITLGVTVAALTVGSILKITFSALAISKISKSIGTAIGSAAAGTTAVTGAETAGASLGSTLLAGLAGVLLAELTTDFVSKYIFAPLSKALGDEDLSTYFKNFHFFGTDDYSFFDLIFNSDKYINTEHLEESYAAAQDKVIDLLEAEKLTTIEAERYGEQIRTLYQRGDYSGLDEILLELSMISAGYSECTNDLVTESGKTREELEDERLRFLAGLTETGDTTRKTLQEKQAEILADLAETGEAVVVEIERPTQGITQAAEECATETSKSFGDIADTVSEKASAIEVALTDAGESSESSLTDSWNGLKDKAPTLWDNIKKSIVDKAQQMKDDVLKTSSDIETGSSDTWTDTNTEAARLWDKIKSTVSDKFNTLKTALDATSNNIKTAIQNSWTSVNTEAKTSWQTIKTTVSNLWTSLKSELGKTDWRSLGSNLVNGIKSGISSAWASLKSTVSSLASGLTSTLRSVFAIHSPSKVWAEIGEYLDLGLKKGMKDEEHSVLSTVADMAKNINSELGTEQATLQIGAESDALLSRLNGIAERLAYIVNAFRGINDALNRMTVFNIPAIASGAEVPYKTRLNADTPGTQTVGISDDLDELLSDHSYLLRQILALLERSKLGINSDELAQAIAYALRGATRGYGSV